MGRKRAFELILGGGSLTAADAERIGLITRAVPDDKLEAEAARAHPALPGGERAGHAVRPPGHRRGPSTCRSRTRVRHAEDVYLNQLMGTEDAEEGLRAIMEKRKPVWKDR